jgi:hypothetical protein
LLAGHFGVEQSPGAATPSPRPYRNQHHDGPRCPRSSGCRLCPPQRWWYGERWVRGKVGPGRICPGHQVAPSHRAGLSSPGWLLRTSPHIFRRHRPAQGPAGDLPPRSAATLRRIWTLRSTVALYGAQPAVLRQPGVDTLDAQAVPPWHRQIRWLRSGVPLDRTPRRRAKGTDHGSRTCRSAGPAG